jgi:group I intron endonuclease
MYKLYQITNTVNGKSYIGITQLSVENRWTIHVSHSKDPKYPLQHAIAKYGAHNFTIIVLTESEDRKLISELEEPTIQRLMTHVTTNGYNVAKGGYGGNLGPEATTKRLETIRNYSSERNAQWKERLRLRNLGKTKENDPGRMTQAEKMKGNSHRKDKPHDAVSKEKIATGNKGKVRSPNAIENYKKAAIMRRISCLCCNKEWDLGNFAQHIRRITK